MKKMFPRLKIDRILEKMYEKIEEKRYNKLWPRKSGNENDFSTPSPKRSALDCIKWLVCYDEIWC